MIEDAVSKFSEGVARLQAKDYERAISLFSEAIAVFPQFEPSYRMRAEAHRAMGQDRAAEADLNAVVSITRARLNEAEQSLGGGGAQQPVATSPTRSPNRFAKPKPSPLESPIILAAGAITVVGVLGAVVVMILSG